MKTGLILAAFLFFLPFSLQTELKANDDNPYPENRLGGKFTDRIIPIEGGQLCCAYRKGTGPNLILIPGTFSDSRVYSEVVKHLDRELNLAIVENRGLGKSWPPPENGSIEQCGRDALRIADHLGMKTFYVGGHSLGGMISIELGITSPDRIRGIISIKGWTSWEAARDAFQYDMKSTLSETQLKQAADYRADVLKNWSKEQEKQFGRIWRKWNGSEFLNTTNLPVLELYGDRGRKPATKKQLHIPNRENIKLVWFSGASHKLLIEKPKGVAREINRFVEKVEN